MVQDAMVRGVAMGAALALAVGLAVTGQPAAAPRAKPQLRSDLIARGAYLVAIMDCGGCHTPGALAGKPDPGRRLAGADIGFSVPQGGVVYPSNLTPDPETGLGKWSDADVVRALRQGLRPDGRTLTPVMPWPSYAVLTEHDALSIAAFLRSLAPVKLQVPKNAGPGETPPAPYLTVVEPK